MTGPQPIGVAVKRILLHIIANADNDTDRKAFVMTGYETGRFSVAETFALVASYGLEAVAAEPSLR